MASLGEILSSKIGNNGKSKAYVANALGVGEKTIENYMRGLRSPKPARLAELSKLLKFSLDELSEQNVPRATGATETAQKSAISKESNKHTDKLTTSTKAPAFEMTPSNGSDKDAVIKTLAVTTQSQQEVISKLTDLVTKLIKK